MNADGVGRHPSHRVRVPFLRQTWSRVAFLHWRCDVASLRPLVPGSLDIATSDGSAWVSFVMFEASRTRGPIASPSLPTFAETNVRTYVQDRRGRHGIWFLTLEASNPVVVFGGRAAAGVPYRLASTAITVDGAHVRYRSGRGDPSVGHDITIEVGERTRPWERSALEDWLTGRWRAFSRLAGVDVEVPVEHPEWSLHPAVELAFDENLATACGLPSLGRADLVHVGDPVDVRLGPPRPAGMTMSVRQFHGSRAGDSGTLHVRRRPPTP